MKNKIILSKKTILVMIFSFICCFVLGWLFAYNFGGLYETGYKMAYLEMKQLLKDGVKSKSNFYIKGLDDFKFYPRDNDKISITLEEKS